MSVLCWLGWHDWRDNFNIRVCLRCLHKERYNFNAERWEVER